MGRLAGPLKKSTVRNVQNVVSECHLGSGEVVLLPGKSERLRRKYSVDRANLPVVPIFL